MKIGDKVKSRDGVGLVSKIDGHTVLVKLESGLFCQAGVDELAVIETTTASNATAASASNATNASKK